MLPDIQVKITEGTITKDDINTLIETSFKSAQERILRRTRTKDSNEGHDDQGHAGPARVSSRVAPRRGGGKLNDPKRTARGRRAVTHQESTELFPRAKFVTRKEFEPVCPHCNEVMYEKHFVPDRACLGEGESLYRHRGDCYDKGPFLIEWPKDTDQLEGTYAEATRFILENRGKPITKLPPIKDRAALKRLTARLLTVEQCDRDWYYRLYQKLGV